MAEAAHAGKAAHAGEDARLARDAAAGDGSAFAALFERYEQRAYNLAYRITGSEPDAADATEEAFLRVMRRPPEPGDDEPSFAFRLLTATHNACHGLMEKRQPDQADDEMAGTQREDVRDASMRLPERQREALALRELAGLSYDEIAASMEMSHSSVAQLICRARINLSDELHGTALAAVVAPSRECERALPLIAAREDGQLEAGSDDDAWLDAHLAGCERCRLGVEALREAGASYRAWAPIAVLPWLLEETMAKAAALAGADWSEEIAEAISSRADRKPTSALPTAHPTGDDGEGWSPRRRRATAAAGLAALLLGGGIAGVLAGDESSPIPDRPVADRHSTGSAPSSKPDSKRQKAKRGPGKARRTRTKPASRATTAASPLPLLPPTEAGGGAPSEPPATPAGKHGQAGLQAPQAIAAPKPKPKPTDPPSQPASAPAPPPETQTTAQPPSEEPAPEHPSKGRGPPAGVPRGGK